MNGHLYEGSALHVPDSDQTSGTAADHHGFINLHTRDRFRMFKLQSVNALPCQQVPHYDQHKHTQWSLNFWDHQWFFCIPIQLNTYLSFHKLHYQHVLKDFHKVYHLIFFTRALEYIFHVRPECIIFYTNNRKKTFQTACCSHWTVCRLQTPVVCCCFFVQTQSYFYHLPFTLQSLAPDTSLSPHKSRQLIVPKCPWKILVQTPVFRFQHLW